ncbi:hypothetical protein ACWT_3760 [Actinoplanes sp. SE50]|uniref:hypothetical protein n=1 Tax=unclassified Actinoplanes TaxID=2626549 RepID=UPI00023ECB26|nr:MULTISPECIES: hypothetical protein [unclassified Actinoplanes]AEV84783.1 hypothetical protein ACPL_3888 [Actinoplanes sp. SE50/110]ATO83175.1 hypothetical protein ACWT_3760 [Actinoplanes sp. SE50]SLM00582.1 hypothetical protein ACSP50_3815 [Actinoplanes sp. SE50/110]
MLVLAAVAGILIGLLGGLLVGHNRGRWCPRCGRTLDCHACQRFPAPRPREPRNAGPDAFR